MKKILMAAILSLLASPAAADVYVLAHAPGGDDAYQFSGESTATVLAAMPSLTQYPFEVVSKAAYDAAVAAAQPVKH